MKLDLTGVKLSLKEWLAFSIEERQVICHLPIENQEEQQAFTAYLDFLCRKYRGSPAELVPPMSVSLWDNGNRVPQPVLEKSSESGKTITPEEWSGWQLHERYALYKTALSKSEPEKFFAVLEELRACDD
jgi:hypothetical protein